MHQVKSSWYYIFWGIIAVAVCGGQYYVGSGYREMAEQQKVFAQSLYDTQMGWDAQQQAVEACATLPTCKNTTGQYE